MTQLPEIEFEAGQMVYSLELGFFTLLGNNSPEFPLKNENIGNYYVFTRKGQSYKSRNRRALLTLEEAAKLGLFPPKKKVKRLLECWINVYPKCFGAQYQTKEDADSFANPDRIDYIHIKHEIEVEE